MFPHQNYEIFQWIALRVHSPKVTRTLDRAVFRLGQDRTSLHTFNPPVEQQEEPGIGRGEADPHLVNVDERVEPGGDGSGGPPWGTSGWTCLSGADTARPERLGQHVCVQVSSHFPLNLKTICLLSAKRRTGA